MHTCIPRLARWSNKNFLMSNLKEKKGTLLSKIKYYQ